MKLMWLGAIGTAGALAALAGLMRAEAPPSGTELGDRMIAEYFRAETARLAERCLSDVQTLADWTSRRDEYHRQLLEMLSLDPMPERTDLKPVVTGTAEHNEFTVDAVQFQSSPALYVTGNLYVPKGLTGPAPAILYVCGHGQVVKDGISYGNKVHYQHHGGWFARNGYVCLTIDTVQLGEIEGLHHGTYREGMWWWNSRGYTPAGVEAWNGIRALDYLQSRPEVDGERLGITGRSGGGAYSWWVAALDDRIKVAVPVAGITDLENHVVDGCVEGHCDCMFTVNTYRWDYAQVAALVAPRPLLIANSDKDSIFPLEGVQRIHQRVRKIYRLHGADDKLGLQISEGPHKDTQELQVAAFHWFNRFLKGSDPQVKDTAVALFEPEQLKVFGELPSDQVNSRIHELFTDARPWRVIENLSQWQAQREEWLDALSNKCFAGWPREPEALATEPAFTLERDGLVLNAYDYTSQGPIRLRLYVVHRPGLDKAQSVSLAVNDGRQPCPLLASLQRTFPHELQHEVLPPPATAEAPDLAASLEPGHCLALVLPRGVGRTRWDQSERKQVQHRRRFMLLGQTLAGMQVWDVRRAIQALRSLPPYREARLELEGRAEAAALALYASLFEPNIERLTLAALPKSHLDGPDFLNVLRYLDVAAAVTLAAEKSRLRLDADWGGPRYPLEVAQKLGWPAIEFEPALGTWAGSAGIEISEDQDQIKLVTPQLEAVIRKKGYVSGVAGGSFLDQQTGFRDVGYGLDIVDWIMEPGSDEAYRHQLPDEMVYKFGNLVHGNTPKRSIEGPQICTQAGQVQPQIIRGRDFVAVKMQFQYLTAAPGKQTGSTWTQTLVFPAGKRYFISSDRIDAVNDSPAMFLRVDMPGHIKHNQGDTFSEVYLSYQGRLPASEFSEDFAPDARLLYRRDDSAIPGRFIRAYHLRDTASGADGPWIAGMTLDPADVFEAWCHQRGYICMIEEFGGRPIKAGESFSAAFVVGFFDSPEEMHAVYDQYNGHSGLEVDAEGWRLVE